MPRIEWDASYSVGVEELDAQHKQWISLINELHDVLMGRKCDEGVTPKSCLESMLKYGNYHLAFEERLMEEAGYPLLDQHRREHDRLRRKIEDCLQAEMSGHHMLNSEIMNILNSWLQDHILISDMKMKGRLGK